MMGFYSVIMTLIIYAMPETTVANSFLKFSSTFESTASDLQDLVENERQIPVVNIGVLVFYSGNLILDFVVNFVTAIPSMLSFFVTAYTTLFSIDAYIASYIELFFIAVTTFGFWWALINTIIGIRSGRTLE
jgi:hypothetical protein